MHMVLYTPWSYFREVTANCYATTQFMLTCTSIITSNWVTDSLFLINSASRAIQSSSSVPFSVFALFHKDNHLTSHHLQLLIATTRWNNSLLGESETVSSSDIGQESPQPHRRILIEPVGYHAPQRLAGSAFLWLKKHSMDFQRIWDRYDR